MIVQYWMLTRGSLRSKLDQLLSWFILSLPCLPNQTVGISIHELGYVHQSGHLFRQAERLARICGWYFIPLLSVG